MAIRRTEAWHRRQAQKSMIFPVSPEHYSCLFQGQMLGQVDCRCAHPEPYFECRHSLVPQQLAVRRRFHRTASGPHPKDFAICLLCHHFTVVDQNTTADEIEKLLPAHDTSAWPPGWQAHAGVEEGFRRLMRKFVADIPPPPDFRTPLGAVICGGGWRFFPGVYVTASMLRFLGWSHPIQAWYLPGELDAAMVKATDHLGVEWCSAADYGVRRLGGWEAKAVAAAYSPFETVLSLDADCYPAYNPEEFICDQRFAQVGAAFWPDLQRNRLHPHQWERFGLAHRDETAWESGQFIVDKSRHWRPLRLALFFNEYSDYVYQHVYGDKETFHLAWRMLDAPVTIPWAAPRWHHAAFLQLDFDGRCLFVHRVNDKPRWTGDVAGVPIENHFTSSQHAVETQYIAGMPHEQRFHQYLRESSELIRPGRHFSFRAHTWDEAIWRSIVLENEYPLPVRFESADVVIDASSHIGGFVHACLLRGAGHVIACEPEPANFRLLQRNLVRYGGQVTFVSAAIIDGPAFYHYAGDPLNTRGGYVSSVPSPAAVESVDIQQLMKLAGGKARLLKLGCQSSASSLLRHDLSWIEEIVGDFHHHQTTADELAALQPAFHFEFFPRSSQFTVFRARQTKPEATTNENGQRRGTKTVAAATKG